MGTVLTPMTSDLWTTSAHVMELTKARIALSPLMYVTLILVDVESVLQLKVAITTYANALQRQQVTTVNISMIPVNRSIV
jgi:hypothetical protein